jgi:hypothetical protein
MALSDWNFGPHGPEILVDVGTVGIKRTITQPTMVAEFGSGYFSSVRVGLELRKWTLTWADTKHSIFENPGLIIPIYDDGTIVEGTHAGAVLQYVINPDTHEIVTNSDYGDQQTRMKYIQRFFGRRMQSPVAPFVFVDPAERGGIVFQEPYNYASAYKWLVRFANPDLLFTQGKKSYLWNFSFEIVEVRPGYEPGTVIT